MRSFPVIDSSKKQWNVRSPGFVEKKKIWTTSLVIDEIDTDKYEITSKLLGNAMSIKVGLSPSKKSVLFAWLKAL